MKIFLTGSTGFIGSHLSLFLANKGHIVHALYRSLQKTSPLSHKNIILFKGDIMNTESLNMAMKGCTQVYHTAAFTDIWVKNKEHIYNLNVLATKNILDMALNNNIKRVVLTSTAGVIGPSKDEAVNENTARTVDFFLEYEKTKAIAEKEALKYISHGMEIVIVNPTRVFGPGILNKSNSVTIMIRNYIKGSWRFIPGNGKSIGNYAFIEDVVHGHLLAMENGENGERYILGGSNISYNDFFNKLSEITGKKHGMYKIPLWLMLLISHLAMLFSSFGIKPFITPALVTKFNYDWKVSSLKAKEKINYQITPFDQALKKTVKWLKNNKKQV